MNYTLAAIGAAPENAPPEQLKAYGEAAARLINPALSSFNAGVRGYYFALAAAAWLIGPVPFLVATLGAMALLIWRQSGSRTAKGIAEVRAILDARTASGEDQLPAPRKPDPF
jgi:uncharacterized membrane protein